MRVPIPQDWDGETWACVTLQWPDSPAWLGILQGLVMSPNSGWFWNEQSGDLMAAIAAGWQIYNQNVPLRDCEGKTVEQSGGDIVVMEMEESFAMSLCGYNPNAFKIDEFNQFWVKDFCGEWRLIGKFSADTPPPIETEVPDPPPTGMVDSTPCAMAKKLAVMVHNILTVIWAEQTGAGFFDVWDFWNDVNDAFAGIDLAFEQLSALFFNVIFMDIEGLEGECLDVNLIDWCACHYSPLITASNEGITEDEYNACIAVTPAAVAKLYPENYAFGGGHRIQQAWQDALKAIGPGDAKKITFYAQPVPGSDCGCPEETVTGPTNPTTNGWYLSAPYEVITADSGNYNTPACVRMINEHDAFGVVFSAEWTATAPWNLKRMSATSAGCPVHDFTAWGDTSDHLEGFAQGYKFACGNSSVIDELLGAGTYELLTSNYGTPDNPAVPGLDAGNVAVHGFFGDDMEPDETFKIRMRFIYNTGSPSHQ